MHRLHNFIHLVSHEFHSLYDFCLFVWAVAMTDPGTTNIDCVDVLG